MVITMKVSNHGVDNIVKDQSQINLKSVLYPVTHTSLSFLVEVIHCLWRGWNYRAEIMAMALEPKFNVKYTKNLSNECLDGGRGSGIHYSLKI